VTDATRPLTTTRIKTGNVFETLRGMRRHVRVKVQSNINRTDFVASGTVGDGQIFAPSAGRRQYSFSQTKQLIDRICCKIDTGFIVYHETIDHQDIEESRSSSGLNDM